MTTFPEIVVRATISNQYHYRRQYHHSANFLLSSLSLLLHPSQLLHPLLLALCHNKGKGNFAKRAVASFMVEPEKDFYSPAII